jgi:hypothetical protein
MNHSANKKKYITGGPVATVKVLRERDEET